MSAHFTRDYVWVVATGASILDSGVYAKLKSYDIGGIYLWDGDPGATPEKAKQIRDNGFVCGIGIPLDPRNQTGPQAAQYASIRLSQFTALFKLSDGSTYYAPATTPVLLDVEPTPEDGGVWWKSFLWGTDAARGWRNGTISGYRDGRTTDMTPEPFKGEYLPASDIVAARMDCVGQCYYGDMSPVLATQMQDDLLVGGFPKDYTHCFVDGGRKTPLPCFYKGVFERPLPGGTIIWNCNLMREAFLI